jgi:DNA-binding transcriptional LysR family regulator
LAVWDASLEGVKEGPLTGPISFTTTQDFGSEVVAPLIDRFLELHPGIRFDLLLAEGVLDLVQNHLDFALRHGPLSDSSLRARLLVSGRANEPGAWGSGVGARPAYRGYQWQSLQKTVPYLTRFP